MLTYTGYKVSRLTGKKNIDIVQAVKENHFDQSHVFGAKQGLNIAVAVYNILEPEPGTEDLIDPSYGKIKFSLLKYGKDENGLRGREYTELETHICTPEELGLSGHDHKFSPISTSYENVMRDNKDSFVCVDSFDLAVRGGKSSEQGQQILVDVVKCTDADDVKCRSDDEIFEYFINRQMYVLTN